MESVGDEKKIRALFSELSREDALNAPRFEKLWREASAMEHAPRFSRPLLIVAVTLVVAVTVLFIAWSRGKSPAEQNAQNAAAPPVIAVRPEPAEPATPEPDNRVVRRRTHLHPSRRRTPARRQQREQVLNQAEILAHWKSPTEQFLTPPTHSAFSSLPQLNESVKDLESFLSKKESNQ